MHRGFTGFLALALTVLGGWIFAKFLLPILFPFLVGLALALAAEPLTRLLHRKAGLSRSMGAAISVTLTCAALAVPLAMLGAFALKELTALGSRLPQLEQTARLMESLGCTAAYNLDGGQSAAMWFGGEVISTPYRGGRTVGDAIVICDMQEVTEASEAYEVSLFEVAD